MISARREPDRSALYEALHAALQKELTPRQREIVLAHFFEGLSEGAVASRLGVAQQVIHKALFGDVRRGRRVGGAIGRLRKALGDGLGSRANLPVYNHRSAKAARASRHSHGN